MKKLILGLGLAFGLGVGTLACGGTEGSEGGTEGDLVLSEAEQVDQALRTGDTTVGGGIGIVVGSSCTYEACVKGCLTVPDLSVDYCVLVCRIDSRCF